MKTCKEILGLPKSSGLWTEKTYLSYENADRKTMRTFVGPIAGKEECFLIWISRKNEVYSARARLTAPLSYHKRLCKNIDDALKTYEEICNQKSEMEGFSTYDGQPFFWGGEGKWHVTLLPQMGCTKGFNMPNLGGALEHTVSNTKTQSGTSMNKGIDVTDAEKQTPLVAGHEAGSQGQSRVLRKRDTKSAPRPTQALTKKRAPAQGRKPKSETLDNVRSSPFHFFGPYANRAQAKKMGQRDLQIMGSFEAPLWAGGEPEILPHLEA